MTTETPLIAQYAEPLNQKLQPNGELYKGVDKWKVFEMAGYKPHDTQIAFHKSTARFRVLYAGARFGKSFCAAMEVAPLIMAPNTRGWIVAPTYDLGAKEFRYLYDFLISKLGLPTTECVYNVRNGDYILRFPWGSEVEVRTCKNEDNLLGEELDWVIMAEAAVMRESVWSRYIRMRLHTRAGIAIFATSPKGFGWLFKKSKLGHEPSSKWHTFYGDSRDNPHNLDTVDRDEMSEEDYNEQVLGIPAERGGRCFAEFSRKVHVHPCRWVLKKKGFKYYRCMDFGFTNPFVCLWYAVDHDGNYYFYRQYYQAKMLIEGHAKYMKSFREPIEASYVDHDAKDRRALVVNHDIDTLKAKKDIEQGIRSIKRVLIMEHPHTPSGRKITIDPSCTFLINELEELLWDTTRDQVKEIYVDKVNDSVDCLRYGVHSIEEQGAWGI